LITHLGIPPHRSRWKTWVTWVTKVERLELEFPVESLGEGGLITLEELEGEFFSEPFLEERRDISFLWKIGGEGGEL